MKIVHKNKDLSPRIDRQAKVVSLKAINWMPETAELYVKRVKAYPSDENAWNRLMIIYRKLKEYKKELETINAAIKTTEDRLYKKSKTTGKKLAQLSTAIMKATGLADKKGNTTYQPEPLGKWKKRREWVLKRLKK